MPKLTTSDNIYHSLGSFPAPGGASIMDFLFLLVDFYDLFASAHLYYSLI